MHEEVREAIKLLEKALGAERHSATSAVRLEELTTSMWKHVMVA
jgi:hypothetical protein